MATKVFILFDAYHPEPGVRTVHAVFSSREAADEERARLLANGGRWDVEDHVVQD